jgi:hypothetical protein
VRVALNGAPRAAKPVDFTSLHGRFETADGLFDAAGELVRRVGGRTPLSLPGTRPLALPPGTGSTAVTPIAAPYAVPGVPAAQDLWKPPDISEAAAQDSSDDAVAAYIRAVQTKLTEWFTARPPQISSIDFDDFYFREVHPAAKAALLRHLTPHAPGGSLPRPPRLRTLPTAEQPPGGAPHAT